MRNERPETRRVVELREMAELVDDDIVGDMRRQKRELIVEIKIAVF